MLKDWIEVELGDVLLLSSEKHKPETIESLFYVGLEHIEKDTGRLTIDATESTINTIKNKFYTNQILYGKLRPYLNKVYLATQSGVCSTDILVFNVSEATYSKYAFHFMLSRQFVNDMSANTSGVNLPRVSTKYINSSKFPLAPLPEQRAIAAKIEQLFSELDNGIANLKAAKSKLEIYRQAILKQAFEESINSVCFNLSEITNKIQIGPFGSQLHKEDYIEGGIPLINPMHIQDGQIYPNSSYSITIEKRDSLPNYILMNDDVIMGRRGEMGRCGLITKKEEGWFCGTGSLYLRPIRQKVYPAFLYYYLRSPIIKELLTGKATGTTMMNLNKTIISELPINLPSIEEQIQIVQEIETRLSVCDKLNESIDQSLEKAQALRQSILKKAFEGKLLSQDELQTCRQQPDWEPAAKLLERVKNKKSK